MTRTEVEAQKRQTRNILRVQMISDSVYALIFIAGHCYRECLLLLAFQIPANAMLYRLSKKVDSRFKGPMILLQSLVFFTFANLLGERALVQLLFLSAFLCQVLHLRPRRKLEWLAVASGPFLWNVLEWQNYSLLPGLQTQPGWVITLLRLIVLNSSFVFLTVIFDFLRLRYLEVQNEVLAAGTNLQQTKDTIERQQAGLIQNSRMQAISEIAGGIAHEINNPLSIIEAQHYAMKVKLQRQTVSAPDMLESLQSLEQTTGRIAQIIQGLLEISGDRTRDPFEPVPVLSILDSIELLCFQRFQHHGIELDIQKKEGTDRLLIPCHRSRIAQVLLNLLSNAFDAVVDAEERWVRVRTVHDSERVVFIISDSGPGVPPQQRERLFQPFSSSKPIGKGIGLGLSIAKGIVLQHQGHLWLDLSAQYTTFKVELPLAQASEIPGQP